MDIPQEAKIKLLSISIQIGAIILLQPHNCDHKKFCIVVGFLNQNDEIIIGFLYINTGHNNLDFQIQKVDYPFLNYNSYICCREIFQMQNDKIIKALDEGTASIISQIKQDDIDKLFLYLDYIKVIPPKKLRMFGIIP